MIWKPGTITGVDILPFSVFSDERGWLAELFRADDIAIEGFPAMGYLSVTLPGVARGPHEHTVQIDRFAFFHGQYKLFLWDSRTDSTSSGARQILDVGFKKPVMVTVPPGVVHAYRNVGDEPAYVLNFPNKLFAGKGKSGPIDEIRHEDRPDSPFLLLP